MISTTISKNKEFLEKFENISDPYESLSKISSINYEKLVQHQPLSPSDISSLIIPSPEKLPAHQQSTYPINTFVTRKHDQ